MKEQNDKDETIVLKDKSIIIFREDGSAELYPSKEWKKPRSKDKYGVVVHCHTFKFKSKEDAISVFTIIENQL